jgi:hypothetical protein
MRSAEPNENTIAPLNVLIHFTAVVLLWDGRYDRGGFAEEKH